MRFSTKTAFRRLFGGSRRGRLVTGLLVVSGALHPLSLFGQNTFPSSGDAGIGTSSPAVPLQFGSALGSPGFSNSLTPTQLYINDQPTTTASGTNSSTLSVITQPNLSSNSSSGFYGLLQDLNVPSTSTVSYGGTLSGGIFSNLFAGSGSVSQLDGLWVRAADLGTSTSATDVTGLYATAAINGSTQATSVYNLYGIDTSASNFSTAGAITNEYGIYASAANSGTVTNGYGLYLTGFATGGTHTNTPYDLYAADSGAFNYFAGNVGIGTGVTSPVHPLQVAGTIGAEEVIVSATGADYVFDDDYRLAPLSEVAAYVKDNHHLPDIPSAEEVKEKGVSLGEMQTKLLAKVEELTLHMIEAEERNSRLAQENLQLKQETQKLQERVGKIEAGSTGK